MVQLNFNAQDVRPNIAFEPLPTGEYTVSIVEINDKPTKTGTGSYLEVKMQVKEGEFAGRYVYDRLNLRNQSQQAMDIAYSTLSALCHVTGRLTITNTDQLIGPPFKAIVRKIVRTDNPNLMGNDVAGYKDIHGNAPQTAGTVTQPQAQPAWAQQQYAPQPAPNSAPQQAPQAPQAPQQYPQAPGPAQAGTPGQYTPASPQQQYVQPAQQPPYAPPQAAPQPAPMGPQPGAFPTQGAPPPWVQPT